TMPDEALMRTLEAEVGPLWGESASKSGGSAEKQTKPCFGSDLRGRQPSDGIGQPRTPSPERTKQPTTQMAR
ncbi:MAG: hypothetical protein J7M08_04050, partial [Planctomycetes bacterium]|nr:hypothetical protein [Planctomycetota bacterium]